MNEDQRRPTANSTDMTDTQAVTNNLPTRPGRGARHEPGAEPSQDLLNEKISSDTRGDLPGNTIPDSDPQE
ncbi:hypothetical protein [Deinococcus soli (ex Cha et al. 2016)]|uniref:hypothetical protein n=1 Tax=Deinococcus soli (ex Cha et al. 2016) TaxID=1309411 RepID=UPI001667F921|nr:hypothetical protein [Deinococcus soli (ex Cha et al. 2016)]GGB82542.1 hypothetical protein GCM10008019_43400 [Deinococcus soli (ex Cha et al. 2016)]